MSEKKKIILDIMNRIKVKVNFKGKGIISEQNLKDIVTLYEDIKLLKEHQITEDNFGKKVTAYYNFRKKAFENYGIELSPFYPFKNPTALTVEIYNILLSAKLDDKQIKAFYELVEETKPSESTIKRHTHKSFIAEVWENMVKVNGEEEALKILENARNEPCTEQTMHDSTISDEQHQLDIEYEESLIKNRDKFSRILQGEVILIKS